MGKNSAIANEFIKYGTLTPRKNDGFFMKPKSQQTIQNERTELKYNSRRNQCDVCFTAKSNTGACMCDE